MNINLKPQFIVQDYVMSIDTSSFYISSIIIILICSCISILYIFFHTEMIFIYNMLFKESKSVDDIENYKAMDEKLNSIFKSSLYCNEDILHIKHDGTYFKAKALNNDDIHNCKNLIT